MSQSKNLGDTSMSMDHEEDALDNGGAEDLHILEGPLTRSKARALQEVVRSCMTIPYAEQGATKILHVATCALRAELEETLCIGPGLEEART